MKNVRLTTILNRSAKQAFSFTINPANTPKWVEGVVKEETNESPTKLGTIYRNQGTDGSWAEFEITAFEPGVMFAITKKGDKTHVKYTFKPLSNNQCELEYYAWVDDGEISERFTQENIQKILLKLSQVVE